MATQKFIFEAEEHVIQAIDAVKIEVAKEDNFRVYPQNEFAWLSLRDNCQLLIDEINKYTK